jgi:hypothetical protein
MVDLASLKHFCAADVPVFGRCIFLELDDLTCAVPPQESPGQASPLMTGGLLTYSSTSSLYIGND